MVVEFSISFGALTYVCVALIWYNPFPDKLNDKKIVIMAKPFLKWAGGKSQLIPEIMQRLPNSVYEGMPYQYVEPFGGSGAVALNQTLMSY